MCSTLRELSQDETRDINTETDEPVLCNHCGRTASNGLVCVGMCVADSGY